MKLIKKILFLSLVFVNSNVTAMEDDGLERLKSVECGEHIEQVHKAQRRTTQNIASKGDIAQLHKLRLQSNTNDYMSQLPINVMVKITEYLPKEKLFSLAFCSQYYLRLVKQSPLVSARFSNIVNESDHKLLYRYVLLCPEIRCNIADVFKKITLVEVMLHSNDSLNSLKKIPEFTALLQSLEVQEAVSAVQAVQKSLPNARERLSWDNMRMGAQKALTFLPRQIVCVDQFRWISLKEGVLSYMHNINGLTILEGLDLSDNKISNAYFIQDLINLKSLNLSRNQIVFIPNVSRLQLLQDLDLSGNDISDASFIQDLINLKSLNLAWNLINFMPDMSGFIELRDLNLCGNKISDASFIQGLINLKWLNLSRNLINVMPDISRLQSLCTIQLSQNKIRDIYFIQNLINLTLIDISQNQVELLPNIDALQALTMLYLYGNNLQRVDSIENLRELTELLLSRNRINVMPNMSKLQKLETLYLSGNPLCVSSIKGLSSKCQIFLDSMF